MEETNEYTRRGSILGEKAFRSKIWKGFQKIIPAACHLRIVFLHDSGLNMGQEKREPSRAHRPAYSLLGKTLADLQIVRNSFNANVGWAHLIPQSGSSIPSASALLALTQGGVLVTEAGYPAAVPTTHARIYMDMSKGHDTGVAICNPGSSAIRVNARAFQSDGSDGAGTGSGFIDLTGKGHDARFAGGLISGLPSDFVGILDISSSAPFAAMTVRSLISAENFLMTTFPVVDINAPPPFPVVFPQIADGDGYRTQILLLSPGGAASKVTVRYHDDHGLPLKIGK